MELLISFNITLLATVYRNDWLTLTTNCLFAMQPLSAISMKPPIRFWLFNLLFWFTRSKYIRNKIKIDYLPRYWAFCIRKPRFQWRKHKKCYSWGSWWNLYIYDIENFEDLPGLVFIDEECVNLKVVDWW